MAILDRYQNPVLGSTVRLKFFVLNSNMSAQVQSINEVRIYFLSKNCVCCENPDGRTLIEIITSGSVVNPEQGEYYIDLFLDPGLYTEVGRYVDEWDVTFSTGDSPTNIDQLFQIYTDLWYTTPIPIVYDFSFYFQPNKIKFGSKKFIEIEIIPNVPRATDLCAYYENLAISAQLYITISQKCGECVPCEQDLRTVVDRFSVQYREKNRGFYFIDTTQFDCGIYDVSLELDFGGNVYISDTNQLQIFS